MAEAAGGAGAGSPAAGGTPAGQANGGAAGSPGPTEWTSGFSDDMKGYVQNKGWKNAQEVADSYRNFEKSMGVPKERLLHLPESMESPEGRAVWERLGAPKDPSGYKLDPPADTKDVKSAEWLAKTFHELGVPKTMAEGFAKKANERIQAQMTQSIENQKIALNQSTEKLKTEWGAAYDKNMNLAKSGAMALELAPEMIDQLAGIQGADKLFKTLSKIGAGVGESTFVAGRPAGAEGAITPEQARSELQTLKQDQGWVQRYLAGDYDAKKKMEHLQKMAAPGDMRLT